MTLEVELKVFCGQGEPTGLARAHALGWKAKPAIEQQDIYYTSTHKDFIASEECLRIRAWGDRAELTWKPPTSPEMRAANQYWKEEIDLDITGQVEIMRTLLARLEFEEYAVVNKTRHAFAVDGCSLVCFDAIGGLGWFVEVETKAHDAEGATARNETILHELALDRAQRVSIPYRDLVKHGGRQLEAV